MDLMAGAPWIEATAVPGNDKNWLLPVLLEVLEKSTSGESEMCQCLKDFSAPNILQVEADSEAKENVRYQYDTCLGQNLQDYTQNGNLAAIAPTAQATEIAINRDRKRYRADPFLEEVKAYFDAKTAADAAATVASDSHLNSYL